MTPIVSDIEYLLADRLVVDGRVVALLVLGDHEPEPEAEAELPSWLRGVYSTTEAERRAMPAGWWRIIAAAEWAPAPLLPMRRSMPLSLAAKRTIAERAEARRRRRDGDDDRGGAA